MMRGKSRELCELHSPVGWGKLGGDWLYTAPQERESDCQSLPVEDDYPWRSQVVEQR